MNFRRALPVGGLSAAACVACCAPPIIAALGVTLGLAAVVGVFLGIAAALAVILGGAGWMAARRSGHPPAERAVGPVPVASPATRLTE